MQNLRQLKSEIRAALQLAIATENEKLEEALLNYRTNLAKLEQEYMGDGVKQEGRMIFSPQEAVDEAVPYPLIVKKGEEEEIRKLDKFPNDWKETNLVFYRAVDDVSGNGLQNSAGSKSKSKSDTAMQELVEISPPQEYIPEIKKSSNVYEVFREAGYSFQRVDYGIFDEFDDINIVDENGNVVYVLECYKDFQWDWKGDPIFENSATTNEKLLALLADSPRERKRTQLAEMLENSAAEGGISPQALSLMYEGVKEFEDDEEIQNLINEITQDPEIASEWEALSAEDKNKLGECGMSEAAIMALCAVLAIFTGIQIKSNNDTYNNILACVSVVSSCFAVGLVRKMASKLLQKGFIKIIGIAIKNENILKGISASLTALGIKSTVEDVKTFLEYCLEIDMEPEPIPYVRGEYRSPFGFQN